MTPKPKMTEEERKARQREQARAWYVANRERVREQARAWYVANSERVREQSQAWYVANSERAREKVRAWRAVNPERAREISRHKRQNRRARLRGAIDPCRRATSATTARRDALFGNACCFCGAGGQLTLEHVVALADGGLHIPSNLAPACGRCNSSKGATPVESWYPRQPFFSTERWEFLQAHTGNHWAVAEQLSLSLPTPTPAATPEHHGPAAPAPPPGPPAQPAARAPASVPEPHSPGPPD